MNTPDPIAQAQAHEARRRAEAKLKSRRRRDALAGWIAGVVLGLSQAWWWGNVYLAMSCLVGGIALWLTIWYAINDNP